MRQPASPTVPGIWNNLQSRFCTAHHGDVCQTSHAPAALPKDAQEERVHRDLGQESNHVCLDIWDFLVCKTIDARHENSGFKVFRWAVSKNP